MEVRVLRELRGRIAAFERRDELASAASPVVPRVIKTETDRLRLQLARVVAKHEAQAREMERAWSRRVAEQTQRAAAADVMRDKARAEAAEAQRHAAALEQQLAAARRWGEDLAAKLKEANKLADVALPPSPPTTAETGPTRRHASPPEWVPAGPSGDSGDSADARERWPSVPRSRHSRPVSAPARRRSRKQAQPAGSLGRGDAVLRVDGAGTDRLNGECEHCQRFTHPPRRAAHPSDAAGAGRQTALQAPATTSPDINTAPIRRSNSTAILPDSGGGTTRRATCASLTRRSHRQLVGSAVSTLAQPLRRLSPGCRAGRSGQGRSGWLRRKRLRRRCGGPRRRPWRRRLGGWPRLRRETSRRPPCERMPL